MNDPNFASDLERFNSPPPPPDFHNRSKPAVRPTAFCVRCNATSRVSQRTFKRAYVSPVTYLLLLLGPLIGLLIILLLRVQHQITLPYCEECWRGFGRARVFEAVSLLSFFAALVIGFILMMNLNSGIGLLLPIAVSIALIVIAQRNTARYQPKYKKVDRNQAIVAAGRYGEIVFSKATKTNVRPGFGW